MSVQINIIIITAELTFMLVIYPEMIYLSETVTHLGSNRLAVAQLEFESMTC